MIRFEVGHTYKNLISGDFKPITVVKRTLFLRKVEIHIYDSNGGNPWFATCEKDVEVINSMWGIIYRADEELKNDNK